MVGKRCHATEETFRGRGQAEIELIARDLAGE